MIGFTKPSGEYVADQYSPQGLKLSRYKWSGTWGHSTYYLWSGRDVIEERSKTGKVYTRYHPGISAVLDPGTEREWLMYTLYDSFGTSAAEIRPDGLHIVDFDEFGIKREGCLDWVTSWLDKIWDEFLELFGDGYDPDTDTHACFDENKNKWLEDWIEGIEDKIDDMEDMIYDMEDMIKDMKDEDEIEDMEDEIEDMKDEMDRAESMKARMEQELQRLKRR